MNHRKKRPRVIGERQGRWLLNLYPPFLLNRIRVLEIRSGFRYCRVRVAKSLLTRNLNGSTFGGSIFSAADPFYPLMYWQVMARRGEAVRVWLKSASISYLRPANSSLTLEFSLSDKDLALALSALDREGRFVWTYRTEAVDRSGKSCAVIETEVYLRRPLRDQKGVSAF